MQSEVNQEENLNRIFTVPNLLSFSPAQGNPILQEEACIVVG